MDPEDEKFLKRIKDKIEQASGRAIDLELDERDRTRLTVDMNGPIPKLTFGADAIKYPGLARMFTQYSLLCLKEQRQVSEEEFTRFLRRN